MVILGTVSFVNKSHKSDITSHLFMEILEFLALLGGFMAFLGGFMCWMLSFYIIADKNRGVGYLVLAFLFPIIGFIMALCLKRHKYQDCDDDSLKSLDISKK